MMKILKRKWGRWLRRMRPPEPTTDQKREAVAREAADLRKKLEEERPWWLAKGSTGELGKLGD